MASVWDRRLRTLRRRRLRRQHRARAVMIVLSIVFVLLCVLLWAQRRAADDLVLTIERWIERIGA